MSNDSLKEKIKIKLKDLGAFVDDELPDYIMVMVTNKKTKEMMIEDLQLFLTADTEAFCNWLHDDVLSKNVKKTPKSIDKVKIDKSRSRSPHSRQTELMDLSFNNMETNEFKEESDEEKPRKLISYKEEINEDQDYLMSSVKVVNQDSYNRRSSSQRRGRSRRYDDEVTSKMLIKAVTEAQESVTTKKSNVHSRIGRVERIQTDPKVEAGTKRGRPDIKSRLGAIVRSDSPEPDYECDVKRIQLAKDEEKKSEHLPENLERCRFWPNCNKPEGCNYIHPSESCKNFPNCRNSATACLYIHPTCKYDGECTRPDCIYSHLKPKLAPTLIANGQTTMQCKYFPHCTNQACPFIHPIIPAKQKQTSATICRYGKDCRNRPTCPFQHPKAQFHNPSTLKWVSPNIAKKSDEAAMNEDKSEHRMSGNQIKPEVTV